MSQISGKRVRRTRLVWTAKYIVAVEVDAVYPKEDPVEACFKSENVRLLREVEERAEQGDLPWLQRHGNVYQAVEAGSQGATR
jgi:hypothetical protein